MNKQILTFVLIASTLVGILVLQQGSVQKTLQQTFEQWKLKFNFGADLTESELLYRIKVFESNLLQINEHNSKLGKTYELGLNQFSALTKEEFASTYLTKIQANSNYVQVQVPEVTGPSIDWVSWGAVSPVKFQGSCVASYAFSAVGAIEGTSAIFFRTQQEYSVQQVVDCSSTFGNNGCYNGRMDNTFSYVKSVGINTWSSYPYVGGIQQCRVSSGLFKIAGYTSVSDCNNLATALTVRPVSVAVDGANMQSYNGGIFWNCGTNLSLPLLLVGMTDSYWTLKNSMGTAWGQNGYIRLQRGNTCGVCMAAVYPNPQ